MPFFEGVERVVGEDLVTGAIAVVAVRKLSFGERGRRESSERERNSEFGALFLCQNNDQRPSSASSSRQRASKEE